MSKIDAQKILTQYVQKPNVNYTCIMVFLMRFDLIQNSDIFCLVFVLLFLTGLSSLG